MSIVGSMVAHRGVCIPAPGNWTLLRMKKPLCRRTSRHNIRDYLGVSLVMCILRNEDPALAVVSRQE